MNSSLDNITALRTQIEAAINGDVDLDDLRTIRKNLNSQTIRQQFRYIISTLNDPDARSTAIDEWQNLHDAIGEYRGGREFASNMVLGAGVGGSVGLLGGAIWGAASAVAPPVVVFVVVLSVVGGGRSYLKAKHIAKEIVLLKQIEAAVEELLRSVAK